MLEFPDVSHYQSTVKLTGAQAAVAKATQGTGYADPTYPGFRKQAAALGIPFAGYHWFDTTDPAAQARWYHTNAVGAPCMWDAEADGATVPRILAATAALKALGGHAWGVYLPHWWWQGHLGSPDLRPLQQAGLALVSSDYRTTPPGAGWVPYGGVTPTVWQYTDKQVLNGVPCDFNRYQGTQAQLAALFAGTPPPPSKTEVDMAHFLSVPNGGQYMADPCFERIWPFDNYPLWQKVYAAAGKPPTVMVDLADVNAGMYGQLMGVYKVPRVAPAAGTGPSAAEIADAVVDEEHARLAE
jgi:hypothetical protein